jgi:DUF3043 family protein
VKLRLPGRRAPSETTPDAGTDGGAPLMAGTGKGRPTPKRAEAQGRRQGPPPPPPTTRKEAYKRMRESQAGKGGGRSAGARGDDALPARDRGPARRLVRDVVDTRRNAGSLFLVVAALVLAGYFIPNTTVQSYTVFVWFAFFLLIAADSVLLGRKIKTTLEERLPDHPEKTRTLVWYGISRATMVRRWRFPKPRLGIGEPY